MINWHVRYQFWLQIWQFKIVIVFFIQNTHLSLECIFLCNDVLKIYNRTITANSSHTGEISFIHAYQFTIHIKLNSKNTIWRLEIYVCSLKQEWSSQIKENHCVYVYLFVRVHVHIINALMGLSLYILTLMNIIKILHLYPNICVLKFITAQCFTKIEIQINWQKWE